MGHDPPQDVVTRGSSKPVHHGAFHDIPSSNDADISHGRPLPPEVHQLSAGANDGPPASPGSSSRGSNHNSDYPTQPARSESSSTPPTSLMPTPEPTSSKTDPFASLSFPKSAGSNDTQHRVNTRASKSATLLTSETLRPLDTDGGSSSRGSGPSVASSSEAHDRLGPLPAARPAALDRRPSLPRNPPSTSRSLAPPRIPLPSPPAMGLSELLSGTSLTPGADTCYFSAHHSEPSSGSRRTPHYSPFRSYYGDLPKSELDRSSVIQGETASETLDNGLRPEAKSSPSARRPTSDTASSRSFPFNQGKRDPHVQNNDGVLAPHGSFTSSRPAKAEKPFRRPGAPASDSQLYLGTSRKPARDMDDQKRQALEKAAAKGDQLAMYRLGWRADTPSGQRYNLGSVETVWGPSSP
jgi:hypothetical protein